MNLTPFQVVSLCVACHLNYRAEEIKRVEDLCDRYWSRLAPELVEEVKELLPF